MENTRNYRLLLAAICAVYIAVRLWRLTFGCLWFDEIFSVHAAGHSWSGMWWFVAQDLIHPPLFYALLKVWIGIGGESLLWLRLFPALFAAVALVPFLYLCRELKLKASATVIAFFLFASNGSLIKYAQEVRMYSLLLCLSLFSIWLFARFFNRGKNIWILTAVNILLVHTHYFGWLVVTSELLIILIMQRIKIRHVLIMSGIAAVSFVPWLIAVMRASSGGSDIAQNIGWIGRPGVWEVADLVFDLFEPFYFQMSSADPRTLLWASVPMIAVFVIAKVAYLAEMEKEARERIVLLSIFLGLPVTAAFLLSWLSPYSVWGARHLVITFAPVAILFAIFLSEIRSAALRNTLLAVIGIVAIAAFVRTAANPPQEQIWCAWEKLAEELPSSQARTVYVFEDLVAYHLWFASRTTNITVIKSDDVPGMIEDKAYFLPRGFEAVGHARLQGVEQERIWIAFRAFDDHGEKDALMILVEKGYRAVRRFERKTNQGRALLIEMERTSGLDG